MGNEERLACLGYAVELARLKSAATSEQASAAQVIEWAEAFREFVSGVQQKVVAAE